VDVDLPLHLKPLAARMVPGVWPTAQPCNPHFRLLTSMRSVFLGCWPCSGSTELNRRMRTRMYVGVARGEWVTTPPMPIGGCYSEGIFAALAFSFSNSFWVVCQAFCFFLVIMGGVTA
jgi:hypothetical protein